MLGAFAAAPLAGALAGCVGLGEAPAHVYYELDDLGGGTPPAAGARVEHTLLVAGSAVNGLLDSTALAFSRAAGARQQYQFASWSERPAQRIARLMARRLREAQVFRDVVAETAPVRGDWLLELQLEQLFHDDAAPPGEARIEVTADLVDRLARRSIARRRFVQREPLAGESAAQAVAAFDRALTRLLDEASAWVLAQAARPPG
ncbi:MAG: hypothetical protein BGO72_00675 [Burkholderiales bacterium 70-64]|nr:MAG: hypothetical protein BGO72_00675 [Burkholderiales bacterium 70-64]